MQPQKKKNGGGESENRHYAASEEDCEKMAKRNGWDLKDVEQTGDPVMSVDCIFYGEQTNFQDQWHDNQD